MRQKSILPARQYCGDLLLGLVLLGPLGGQQEVDEQQQLALALALVQVGYETAEVSKINKSISTQSLTYLQ